MELAAATIDWAIQDCVKDLPLSGAREECGCRERDQEHDKQTTKSNDALEKIVCLRNSRTAVTVLKKIYVDARGEARRA